MAPPEQEINEQSRYLNRELSWLDFNERVLALAQDPATPLLERVKFLAIFSQNLDEFFQVRVATIKNRIAAGVRTRTADGLSQLEQLRLVQSRASELSKLADETFMGPIRGALDGCGIHLSSWDELDEDDRAWMGEEYQSRIFPVLTPLAVDPGHPFPYISSLSLNLGVVVRDPSTGNTRFARVKVPSLLPRFVVMPDGERFVALENVIGAHIDSLFPGMEVLTSTAFRVTRNADLSLDDDDTDDLMASIESELRRRRFGKAVRLEVEDGLSDEMLELLVEELDINETDVVRREAPLDLGGLWAVHAIDRDELKYSPYIPVTPPRMRRDDDDEALDMFRVLRNGDMLVHHPYEGFVSSVEEFIHQAAVDPKVLAIKLTLYRTSGDSPIVASLVRAAEAGKQVAVLVELKARFDEERNIEWARRLENAGVHVVYGLVGLKIHTKICLVVRNEPEGARTYCHIGTGNYNSITARIYEDLGLFTADAMVGQDLMQLFNYLTGYARDVRYERLLVAPHTLRSGLKALIRNERSAPAGTGHITMKMNSLVDPDMIDELYAASSDGVRIDLIIRGICCLRPGVPGLSENITVRSIVGRYLEHSRVYAFANGSGGGEPVYLIGSADLMPRNLDHRVEAVTPVVDPDLKARLSEILDANLADDSLAWALVDSKWSEVPRRDTLELHEELEHRAQDRSAAAVR
ncbi:MAG: polyphosphate kinase 1 [Microthrixaceae bacterium]|nr:polyphosphate kinase 1 [Microthrixaceae bacterium]